MKKNLLIQIQKIKAHMKGDGSGESAKYIGESLIARQPEIVRNVYMILWTVSVLLIKYQEIKVLSGDVFHHVGLRTESHLTVQLFNVHEAFSHIMSFDHYDNLMAWEE